MVCRSACQDTHIKKRGTFFAFIGFLRPSTAYASLTTTSKAHAYWRERRCFTQGCISKVSKFQKIRVQLLRFSYMSYNVRINYSLCFIGKCVGSLFYDLISQICDYYKNSNRNLNSY